MFSAAFAASPKTFHLGTGSARFALQPALGSGQILLVAEPVLDSCSDVLKSLQSLVVPCDRPHLQARVNHGACLHTIIQIVAMSGTGGGTSAVCALQGLRMVGTFQFGETSMPSIAVMGQKRCVVGVRDIWVSNRRTP